MNSNGYIYVRNHPSYDLFNVCKLGKTQNIPERDATYATGEIIRGSFNIIFEVPIKKMGIIERLLQYEFRMFNIRHNAGTEFYDKQIITLIEPYLINLGVDYKKLSNQEIHNLLRINRKRIDIKDLIRVLQLLRAEYKWIVRDYQTEIINFCKKKILTQNKIYIELPTGGGKSYIVYNLLDCLKSDFIIIISPRIIINTQNISQKYLQILKTKYSIFNYSSGNNFDEFLKSSSKKIIICCTQSINKIYDNIKSNKITNISIWFDEAHWGIENHAENIENFWLYNQDIIKYRIFTSASPDKQKVIKHENIFGKLYSPIKVKELIDLKWLTQINPLVYSENIENANNIKYIIDDFTEKNRSFGFSFHNNQKNAFILFYNHYTRYIIRDTLIKPFLLVGDDFTNEKDVRITKIKLDYDYRNIKTYENSIFSIGYVVARFSMGYDFNKIDFIHFSDPKSSSQDIKQCIGRGIRPDMLGNNGTNKEKILVISLPVYIDEEGNNKYEKIIEVLKYLLHDIEIQFEEIEFKNRDKPDKKIIRNNIYNEQKGKQDIKSILLDLLELDRKKMSRNMTYKEAKKIIAEQNMNNKEKAFYYELCEKDDRLSKEPEILFKGDFINWIDYLSVERRYYDLDTCKIKIDEYLMRYPELKKNYLNLSLIVNELCSKDKMFPPNDLWTDYYDVKSIQEIIIIKPKKKLKNILSL
jgi:superfamily II DNA or RNA helicase